MKKIAILLLTISSLAFSGELEKAKKMYPQCGARYWEQLSDWGKVMASWQLLPAVSYIEVFHGYVFVLVSEATYPPCEIKVSENPLPIYRKNTIIVRKDKEEIYRNEWLGGVVVSIKLALADDGNILLFTNELLFETFSRNEERTTSYLRFHTSWVK